MCLLSVYNILQSSRGVQHSKLLSDVLPHPAIHHELTASGEPPYSELSNINIKVVVLGVLTSEAPKETDKDILALVPKSTEEVKPSSQQQIPAPPTSEANATALHQTTAPAKHPQGTLPLPEPVQAQ